MYADYFGLDEAPFAITPDPRYLYLGKRHAEALAHLLYGIREGGGFVLLTGEVGTGKTTLTRCLLDELPAEVDVAVLLNPRLDVTEFLEAICQELGLDVPEDAGNRRLVDALNRYLLDAHARGRRTVLIVDEAQNLSADVLEQVRLLTNLETAKTKLLQILLIGQPELRDLLARPELRQLAQRVTARYHLEPLQREELGAYVNHRLGIAGARAPLFGMAAIKAVWKFSEGIPRRANILCDRALLGAWSAELREVTPRLIRQAAQEIEGPRERNRHGAVALSVLLLVAALAAALPFA
ncbi:MAG: AAA family ATPase [Proteobacteria bacterium]|nr:AAA family ATPase [Pseudomonadota bacterium]